MQLRSILECRRCESISCSLTRSICTCLFAPAPYSPDEGLVECRGCRPFHQLRQWPDRTRDQCPDHHLAQSVSVTLCCHLRRHQATKTVDRPVTMYFLPFKAPIVKTKQCSRITSWSGWLSAPFLRRSFSLCPFIGLQGVQASEMRLPRNGARRRRN